MKLSNYGISIQDALTLISSDYEQLGTFLAQNPQALQRAQKFLNERMQEKLEIDNRRQGNIKVCIILERLFIDNLII
jgi:hypothetical protein